MGPNSGLISFLFFLACLLYACGSTVDECPLGDPTPIFTDTLQAVQQHEFSRQEDRSEEQIQFRQGPDLTIYQSGCENLRQEFQFVANAYSEERPAAAWVQEGADQFYRLADLGEPYRGFAEWARFMELKAEDFKLAEARAVEPGYYITVDHIKGQQNGTLIVILSR